MKLISAHNEYRVINLIKRDPRYSIYRCAGRNGKNYLLYKIIKDELLENALVARFNEFSPDFDGFSELFADSDDSLVLVFKDNILEKTTAELIDDDIGENIGKTARLRFFERVLEALCVHEVPENIACDLLENDNIGVRSDGGADCRYILGDISVFGDRNMTEFSGIFAKKLTLALSPTGKAPEVEKFCESLKTDPPKTVTDLYDRYTECVESCVKANSGETKADRIKNKLKKVVGVGKYVLTAAVLVMACLFLIMSFFDDGKKELQRFDRIGEVIIEENNSE